MNRSSLKGCLILMLTAFIWGSAFLAQSVGMTYIGPFTFDCLRSILGGLVLLPVIWIRKALSKQAGTETETTKEDKKTVWKGGLLCGVVLFCAMTLQQVGIQYTTAGKAAFVTALYILIVPLLGLFLKKRPSVYVWISIFVAGIGMYLLCVMDADGLSLGDWLELGCAICYSFHILVIDHFASRADCVKMSCIQFFTVAALSLIPMLVFEHPAPAALLSAWLPIAYAGVLSSGVAYTLQMVGQKTTPVAVAPLIMSLESVFAALTGWILFPATEALSAREILGCVLIFGAVILAQKPEGKKKGKSA